MKRSQRGQMRDIKERAIEATKIKKNKKRKKKKKKREGATLQFFFLRSTLVLQSSTCTS